MKRLVALVSLMLGSSMLSADMLINLDGQATYLMPSVAQGTADASDTLSYALNRVTPTVKSLVVDTVGWSGVFVHVTSSGVSLVAMEYAPTSSSSYFRRGYTLQGEGSASLRNLNRFLRFTVLNPSSTGLTYTTTSLSFLPIRPNTNTTSLSGGAATAVTVTSWAASEDVEVVGNIGNNVADVGNPVKIGGVGRSSNPTPVGNGNRVNGYFDLLGRQVVQGSTRLRRVLGYVSLVDTSETIVVPAGLANIFRDVVLIVVSSRATNTNTVIFRSVFGGAVSFEVPIASDGGGAVIPAQMHPIPQATAASAWSAQLAVAPSPGGSVSVSMLAVEDR